MVEATLFLLVAVGKVAILEVVAIKVTTTSDAVVMLTSASFTVVNVIIAPVLEGVD